MIRVQDSVGNLSPARVLLDSCSTVNLVTEALIKKLNLATTKCLVSIGAIDKLNTLSEQYAQITFRATHTDFSKTLKFLIVPEIAKCVPHKVFPRDRLNIPANIVLADPQFHLPRPVDMLIAAGTTLSLMSIGQIKLVDEESDIVLQKTRLGWVIAGSYNNTFFEGSQLCLLTSVDSLIERFWKVEDLNTSTTYTSEETACEAHYVKFTTRNADGRYTVRLPFRSETPSLGDSRAQALKRFYNIEKRLNSDCNLKREYFKVMQEYLDMGHMVLLDNEDDGGYYLPHHPVIKTSSDTTKVRVVFDASARSSNGNSLNDILMVGPTIQRNLFEQLLKMRTFKYILTADIEKMYRQVRIHPSDRKFQRIFWYHNGKVRAFELTTVTFGVSSAPFLAIRTLKQLADDEEKLFPRACDILRRDMYVDDLITGGETLEEVLQIRDEVISLLKKGGFNIRQWASNHKEALNNISKHFAGLDWTVKDKSILKTLGVIWDVEKDELTYNSKQSVATGSYTKRRLLSEISKIFDPLGLLSPVVLNAKLLIQDCWKAKLNWDESLPQELCTRWFRLSEQLHHLREVKFDRHLLNQNPVRIEIHGFCDASFSGYGACIYIRSIDDEQNSTIRLACAKSRVAPVDKVTIPRLELCAAEMLAKLYKVVCTIFNFKIDRSVCWSDSTIVLAWLKKSPKALKTFEANRVSRILELGDRVEWRHVCSADNPADSLSRGQSPLEFLNNKQWFQGPAWLSLSENLWPKEAGVGDSSYEHCLLTEMTSTTIFSRFSSYTRLLRIVARILRWRKPKDTRDSPITVSDIEEAESKVLKVVQQECFSPELKILSSSQGQGGNNVGSCRKTRFHHLSPFLGTDGLIRVGGRLKNANLPYAETYPILMPMNNYITDLIINHTHTSNFHAGIQTTLYSLRHKFWILNGRDQVRKIVRKCIVCIKERPSPLQAKMASLPESRVNSAPAFYHVGIDYFGPLHLKEKKKRNRTTIKAYGCVFVCMVTKAVHIELVGDLTTESFLSALKRFIARRGKPRHIYSDNGLNFVGANNKLNELHKLLNSESHIESVNTFTLDERINWHFNPPLSPHFGGLWEAAVKSFKHHLKRVLKDHLITFEEMSTLLTEIEAILNSRPLCTLSTDPNDPLVISPSHLLLARQTENLPELNLTLIPDNRLTSWNFITKAKQDFWSRWHTEYLHELQLRQKWHDSKGKIEPGSVVVIIDKNAPTTRWPLGVIVEVCPGSDGVTRVAHVKTAHGVYKRNITSLCPIPANKT